MSLLERLKRSEQLLSDQYKAKVLNGEVKPNWIGQEDVFWYSVNTKEGKKFYKVNIEQRKKELLFDHTRMAEELKKAELECDEKNLPIVSIVMSSDTNWTLSIGYDQYSFDLNTYECKKINSINPLDMMDKAYSPNGKYYAFIKDFNLYIKDIAKNEETQLTFDGEENYSYGAMAGTCMMTATMSRNGMNLPPAVLWSPDSTKLLCHKTDERKCIEMPLLQSSIPYGQLPKAYSYRTTFPGGEVPKAEFIAFDIEAKKKIDIDIKPMDIGVMGTPFSQFISNVWFNGNSIVYLFYIGRGYKSLDLFKLDLSNGKSKLITSETSDTFIEASPTTYIMIRTTSDNKEIIGFSTRDGWGHLYLYDAETGEIKNQITKGEYVVTNITSLDEENRVIYFTACGKDKERNPYYNHLYRVNYDGSGLKLLTPEDAEHIVMDMDVISKTIVYKHSPTGKFFIDTFSKINMPPKTIIRDKEGNFVMELEDADISQIKEIGWTEPEPFSVKARDGKTDIYGVIYKPSNFDPNKKYPIIDDIYPGPQALKTPRAFTEFMPTESHALAELGFIVIHVDGLGTPFRSKDYHEFAFNNFKDGTLPDHITAIKQLAKDRNYMDIEKVGITGISMGGYATCLALFNHADFYKVGIAGNSYLGGMYYMYEWAEKFMEYPVNEEKYKEMCLLNMVDGLKGKLLIMTGDFDENINAPTQIMLADALIKAKKDFDIFVAPNSGHGFDGNKYIFIRKQFGYFLKHLRGEEIPFDVEFPTTVDSNIF